jgi:hypothetical protein
MATFLLRLPDDLKDASVAQAKAQGVSLNQYISTVLVARIGSQSEATRYFVTRAAQSTRGRAKDVLAKSGLGNVPRPDDVL